MIAVAARRQARPAQLQAPATVAKMRAPMNQPQAEPERVAEDSDGARPRRRLRFELIFASILLAGGLFGLPAAIFAVGARMLGPYADDRGLGRFYADFFGDLAEPSVRAWALALGPLVLVSVVRLVFVGMPRRTGDAQGDAGGEVRTAATQTGDEPRAPEHRRIEPRIGVD